MASACAIAAIMEPTLAFARPGGGGSFHGGGASHGGGGTHGGGSSHWGGGSLPSGGSHTTFDSTTWDNSYQGGGASFPAGVLVCLALMMLLVALVVTLKVAARIRSARSVASDLSQNSNVNDTVRAPSVSLDALRVADPALTEQSIANHVRQMGDALRGSWCDGDMRPARAFVSDGVFSRFQIQLALMRQENRRNVMSDARILSATLECADRVPPLDVVSVRVLGEARDTEVAANADATAIHRALASTHLAPYTEIWTLVRCTGAKTKNSDFAVGRACPSCGAPLGNGERMRCRYCGALVCSGEHDWVLSEITQLDEWRPARDSSPTLLPLRARDPGLTCEVLEDRASYLFWKWVEAGRLATWAPLRKCSTAQFMANGAHLEWTRAAVDVAVGAAEVVTCSVGNDGFDHVNVAVTWSARFNGGFEATPVKTGIRMARKSGVLSTVSMTALVCRACGAPLTETDSTRCDHCNAELSTGEQHWVLEDVHAM